MERAQYGSGEWQFGDLRLPDRPGPHPVVLSIHGGFWRARYGLDFNERLAAWFAAHGYATWNIEYRRVGQEGGGWPGTLLDVAAAADHLRLLAQSHPLDLGRVVAIGHSAGGHLALWLAGRHKLPVRSPLFTPDPLALRGVISLAGVADLTAMADWHQARGVPLSESPVPGLLGGTPAERPERLACACPARLAPLGVPTILIHGENDEIVPLSVSEAYAGAAGHEATLTPLAGVDHFAPIDPDSPSAWPPVAAATARLMG